jgi:hypothetical protein
MPHATPQATASEKVTPVPRNTPPKKRSASPRTRTHAGAAASATLTATAVVDAPPAIAPIAPADPDGTTDLRRPSEPVVEPDAVPTIEPATEPGAPTEQPATEQPTTEQPTTEIVPVTEPVSPPAIADDTEALMRREVQPARPLRMVQVRTRPRVRRVTRIVRHVDPWSVFKVALVFSAFLYGVCLTAGVLLWRVARDTGTIDNVENFFEETGWETFELKGGEIYHQAWIAGLFVAVGLVGFAVLVATLFNLVTDLVGGVRVSVLEEEVVARGERPLKRKDLRTMRRQARQMQRPPSPSSVQAVTEPTSDEAAPDQAVPVDAGPDEAVPAVAASDGGAPDDAVAAAEPG